MNAQRVKRGGLMTAIAVTAFVSAGCSDTNEAEQPVATEDMTTQTLASILSEANDLDTVSDLMGDAGLAAAFDGTAPYTMFAPNDAAMDSLGKDFEGNGARPAMIAVLREHIVPGALSRDDIAAAIEQNGGPVEVSTMGSGTLTFSREGEDIVVASTGGGEPAMVAGELRGANGVVVPIDTVLKQLDTAA